MAKRPKSNKVEHLMATNLDKLAKFEEFCDDLLPSLRDAVLTGKSADDIYKMAQAAAAARAVTIAVREVDSGKALAAIKEVLDRSGGKAKERTELTHKLEKLPEDQLDAILISTLSDHQEDEDTYDQ